MQVLLLNNQNGSKSITSEAIDLLRSHDFPGNVRELTDIVLHGYVMSEDSVIKADIIYEKLGKKFTADPEVAFSEGHFANVFRVTNGNATAAASMIGLSIKQLQRRVAALGYTIDELCAKYGIERNKPKPDGPESELAQNLQETGGNMAEAARRHTTTASAIKWQISILGYKSVREFYDVHETPYKILPRRN